MSPARWRVEYEGRAVRDLGRLDSPVRRRVVDAINGLAPDPPVGELRRLVNRPGGRLRVGERVLLTRDDAQRVIVLERVLPRGRAYDW